VTPPPVISLELRDASGGLLGAVSVDAAELGWSDGPGVRELRFETDRLPLADGRFSIGVALADREGTRVYHRIDRAAEFLVYADEDLRGAVRLDGRWSLVDTPADMRSR
jgi:hypothetical protein